jgi:DNA-directed RNA polymerase specialized sigma24 family protein
MDKQIPFHNTDKGVFVMEHNTDVTLVSLEQLIMGVQSGNSKYQEELYLRFQPMIHKLSRSMSWNDREDAEQELVCELFLAAHRFKPRTHRKP